MKRIVCAVRDRAVDTFGNPFFVPALGAAIRSFADEINSGSAQSALSKHPEDYDLFELGTFDDSTGLFETGTPKQVAIGKDMVTKSKE